MGSVQFDAIKSGIYGALCGNSKVFNDSRNFIQSERSWHRDVLKTFSRDKGLGMGSDCRRTNGRLAILLEAGV
jgi:hypothetical protein